MAPVLVNGTSTTSISASNFFAHVHSPFGVCVVLEYIVLYVRRVGRVYNNVGFVYKKISSVKTELIVSYIKFS